ncbi:MAG: FtsX-like permease family protein [Promethearchaeota archaeon]
MAKILGFFHRLGLMVQFSRTNLKYSFVTLIGLTIGLSMISAALIHLDSTRADYYYTKIRESNLNLKIEANGYYSDDILDIIEDVENRTDSLIREYDLANFFQKHGYFPYTKIYGSLYLANETTILSSTEILGLDGVGESLLSMCVAGSRLPTNQSEVLLFVKNVTNTPIVLDKPFTIAFPLQNINYNVTLTPVGLLTPSTVKKSSNLYKVLEDYPGSDLATCPILTSLHYACSLIQLIKADIKSLYDYDTSFRMYLYFNYLFTPTALTTENTVEVESGLYNFYRTLFIYDYKGFLIMPESDISHLYNEIYEFEYQNTNFTIVSIPLLIIVALLVNFTLALINEKRKKVLALIKMRGVSNLFVFLLMLLETVMVAFGSAFLALLVGIPLSLLFGSSTGLLVFSRPMDLSKVVIIEGTIQNVFFLAGLLVLLLHFPSLVTLSRSSVVLLSKEVEHRRPGKIQLLFGKLDILFLTLGSLGVIIGSLLLTYLGLHPYSQALFGLLYWAFNFLITVSPLLLVLGFTSVFNRFLSKILYKVGQISWQRNWQPVAIAARNLMVSPKVITRTTFLITITLAVMIMFSVSTLTTYNQRVDDVYNMVGSELSYSYRIRSFEHINEFNRIVSDLRNVSGLTFTIVKEWELYVSDPYSYGVSFFFMGIEPDFAEYAHWQSYYAAEPLESLVTTLFTSEANNSAIIDSETMVREHLTLGTTYTIKERGMVIPLSIQAVTNYWPRMFSRGFKSLVITKASYLENVTKITENGYHDPYSDYHQHYNTILAKIQPGYDKNQVVATIKDIIYNRTGYVSDWFSELDVIYEHDALKEDSLLTTFLWFTANANLVTGLVVIVSTIVLFGITRVVRQTQELALSRSLGMKYSQVFRLMFTETFLLFVFSGIFGALMGSILTTNMFLYVQEMPKQGALVPLHIDFLLIIGYYLLFLLIIVVVGIFTSLIAIRANISKILKEE